MLLSFTLARISEKEQDKGTTLVETKTLINTHTEHRKREMLNNIN